jgi:hypothetical protein
MAMDVILFDLHNSQTLINPFVICALLWLEAEGVVGSVERIHLLSLADVVAPTGISHPHLSSTAPF